MKKILLVFILLVVGSTGVITFFWRQATQLPSWYNTTTENPNIAPENSINIALKKDKSSVTNLEQAEKSSQLADSKSVNIKLTEAEINKFIVAKIAERTGGNTLPSSVEEVNPKIAEQTGGNTLPSSVKEVNPKIAEQTGGNTLPSSVKEVNPKVAEQTSGNTLPSSVKGVNTKIRDGKIETGAVVNISEFSNTFVAKNGRTALNKLTEQFPFLNNREVYIGISGKPYVDNGELKFDDNTEVKVGNLSFTIADLSQKLGIPKEQIEQKLNLELQQIKVQLEKSEIEKSNGVIQGSSN
ncbi:hypothetical protein Cri9333_4321 [Crinalium epipsammum PCC 9333]|uniref:Uncharacterized protein n=1 Tax=Crinalium epipsammum PCC 9333 TaxID=1173022 RepID=K9W5T8_9CYAN|nr:hypothetical protein [Crinalium epipsammum]AFZ15107.1 hypothetical protein Cri9333_4321 [Crinalium epipsammum PCC 9333]